MTHFDIKAGTGWGRGMALLHDAEFARVRSAVGEVAPILTPSGPPAAPRGQAPGRGWQTLVDVARDAVRGWREARMRGAAVRELRRLSDGELRELGLDRANLREFVTSMMKTRQPTMPVATVLPMPARRPLGVAAPRVRKAA